MDLSSTDTGPADPEQGGAQIPAPAWITPFLARDRAEADAQLERDDAEQGQARVDRVGLAVSLGVVPLEPALYVPCTVIHAVLLTPGQVDDDGFGVQAGWEEGHGEGH